MHKESDQRVPSSESSVEHERPRTEYRILTLSHYRQRMVKEQNLMEVEYPDDERMRAMYVSRTDRLIQEAEKLEADVILYLDKSARPIQWLVKEFWPIFAPDKPAPESKFVNIDASEWLGKTSDEARPGEDEIYSAEIPQEAIEELRAVFRDPTRPDKSVFDGKQIMVVDEVSVSGGSLSLAVKILSQAFPEASFNGRAWMIPEKVKRGHGMYPKELPVWYHKVDPRGRGVGDIKPGSRVLSSPGALINPGAIEESKYTEEQKKSLQSAASIQQQRGIEVGSSSGVFVQDELSKQLRAEIKQLARDVIDRRQSIIPGTRDDASYYDVDSKTGQTVTDEQGRPISSKFKINFV